MGSILLSVVEWCPLYGGVIFCHIVFGDKHICPLFAGFRCIEVSVKGSSIAMDDYAKDGGEELFTKMHCAL